MEIDPNRARWPESITLGAETPPTLPQLARATRAPPGAAHAAA